MRPHAIRFRGLTLGYDRHPAVHGLDGTIGPGAGLALVGPNGAGKSTLLKAIAGEVPVLDGRIEHAMGHGGQDGATPRPPRGAVAYLPQAAEVDRGFPVSVLDLVAAGLWRRVPFWRSLNGQRPRVLAALAAVGLDGFAGRPIGTLSGGQFQRALFARLTLQDAPVILLDEPFTGIDARTRDDLLGVIGRWRGEGRTVVAALHDLGLVRAHFPETLLLARAPIAWGPTATVLTPRNLARATGLAEAWDEDAAVCQHAHGGAHDHGHAREHGHDHVGDDHRHEIDPAGRGGRHEAAE